MRCRQLVAFYETRALQQVEGQMLTLQTPVPFQDDDADGAEYTAVW